MPSQRGLLPSSELRGEQWVSFVRKNNPAIRIGFPPDLNPLWIPDRKVATRARSEVCVGHLLHVPTRFRNCWNAANSIHEVLARIVSRERFIDISVVAIEQSSQVRRPGFHIDRK